MQETLGQALPDFVVGLAHIQRETAIDASSYTADVLSETGDYVAPEAFVNIDAFTGWAPYGNTLTDAVGGVVSRTSRLIGEGMAVGQAVEKARQYLRFVASETVRSTARDVEHLDILTRPNIGYVRMLNPPSCMFCVMLAGRRYAWNTGFERHPNCDCIHVPCNQKQLAGAVMEGLVLDPYEYFASLDEKAQNRLFGTGNAEAIRAGADMYQVVNAYRPGNLYAGGHRTREGMTRRGYAGKNVQHLLGRRTPRAIFEACRNGGWTREAYLRHLVSHGYILPAGQVPGGSIRGNKFGYGQFGKGGKARTASDTVVKALRAGSRDGLTREEFRYVATVRERRFLDAARDYEEALRGKNPYASGRAWERAREQGIQKGRQWAQLEPLTKDDVKWAETNYRLELRRYLAPWSGKDFQLRARFPELFTLGPGRLPKKRVSSGAGVVSAVKGKTSGAKKATGSKVGVKQKPGVPVLATGGAGGKPPRNRKLQVGGIDDKHNSDGVKAIKALRSLRWDSIINGRGNRNSYPLSTKITEGVEGGKGRIVGGHRRDVSLSSVRWKALHTWFPSSWADEDIREAFNFIVDNGKPHRIRNTLHQVNIRYRNVDLELRYYFDERLGAHGITFYPLPGPGIDYWENGILNIWNERRRIHEQA